MNTRAAPPVHDAGSTAAHLLAALREGFDQALASHAPGAIESCHRFAGRPVKVRIVGRTMAGLLGRTFGHLRDDGAKGERPALRIDLWDEAATGVPCAKSAGPLVPAVVPAESTWFTPDHRVFAYRFPRATAGLDRVTRTLTASWRDGSALFLHERSKPIPELLSIWYEDRGVQQVHAGLAARQGRGALFVGPGGSGKTTTALACAMAGFEFLGDDFVGLEMTAGGPIGHSFYSTARVAADHLASFPGLERYAETPRHPEDDKCLVDVAQALPERMACRASVAAVVLPRVAGTGPPRVRRLRPAVVLREILSATVAGAPGSRRRGFENLAALVQCVPGYALDLGAPGRGRRRMTSALVSCIVPTYNAEAYLGQALDSILNQTYRPIEVIVADDGSTDSTCAIAGRAGPPVRVVTQETAGPAATRNLGIAAATGEFLAFLDPDDLWHPEKLAQQMRCFETDPSLQLCITHVQMFWSDEAGEEAAAWQGRRRAAAIPGYATTTLLARRSAVDAVGRLNPALWFSDAADWFLRAREVRMKLTVLPDVLVFHRVHGRNLTRRRDEASRDEFLHLIKVSLDRRRMREGREPDGRG